MAFGDTASSARRERHAKCAQIVVKLCTNGGLCTWLTGRMPNALAADEPAKKNGKTKKKKKNATLLLLACKAKCRENDGNSQT
jgi:hypothetical protein